MKIQFKVGLLIILSLLIPIKVYASGFGVETASPHATPRNLEPHAAASVGVLDRSRPQSGPGPGPPGPGPGGPGSSLMEDIVSAIIGAIDMLTDFEDEDATGPPRTGGTFVR